MTWTEHPPHGFDTDGYYVVCPMPECNEKFHGRSERASASHPLTLYTVHYAEKHSDGKWVSDELRKYSVPDEFGRVSPFVVYERMPRGEFAWRNLRLDEAERLAGKLAAKGTLMHVSLDTCG